VERDHLNVQKPTITNLKNGLKVVLVPFQGVQSVGIYCWVNTGSAYESKEKNGITHFLEHMLFRGNEKLGSSHDMNLCFEKIGGEINGGTSTDEMELLLHFHRNFLEDGVQRFCKLLQFPRYESLETERSIILEEVKDDYNEEGRLTNAYSISSSMLWKDHPLELPVIGTEKTIQDITLDDLKDWHQRFFQTKNMVIGITGDFQNEDVLAILSNEIKSLPIGEKKSYPVPISNIQKNKQIALIPDKDNQFSVDWIFPFQGLSTKTRVALKIIRRVLDDGFSSRLHKIVREEKGLLYDISGSLDFVTDHATFSISAVVGEKKVEELLDTLVELVSQLIKEGIHSDELDLAKLRYRTSLDYMSDSADGILHSTVSPLLYPSADFTPDILNELEHITIESINLMVQKLFLQKQTILILIGPVTKALEKQANISFADWIL
jgi:predicted Zn-dependent peptidase